MYLDSKVWGPHYWFVLLTMATSYPKHPNDVTKTTVKETTIHDSENLNLSGHDETYSALNDTAKTTVKETTVHDAQILNLKGTTEESYSKYEDVMKTTVNEIPKPNHRRKQRQANFSRCFYNY